MLARLWTIWSRRQAIVALLLPVVGLLGFSGYIVAEKIELLRASGNLREEMALTQALTGLVHELQRERGQAALFLGSQGGLSRQNLEEQFAATDRQHQLFQRRSIAYRNSSGHWPLLPRLQHAEAVTATLPAQRDAVRAGNVSWQEILDSYSTRIAAVLELGSGVAEANGRVRLLAAWAHLAQAKEAIGQERAVGAAALARGVFDWSSLATLNRLEATQDAFIRMFRRNINAETGRFFDLVLTQPALREASELRDQLMAAAAAGRLAPIPPSRWYDALTRKIDNLRIVEERLAADAEQMVQQNVRQAASTVIWTCVVVVVLLMVSWTTLRRSERRAARAGERLVNAIENIPEGFALWGGDGALVLSNSRYEVLDRETRQSLPHSLGSSQREHRLEDGRWLLARTTTLANGERVEIYSDITEDKQRGLAVEASEARLRSILENIGEGIITIDHGGIIRSFNRAAQDIFGHGATDVIGRPVSTVTGDLFDGGDGAAGADPLSASGALPTAACYEGKVPRADGRLLTVEAAITELSLPDETLSVGIFRDITERRRAEEQLRKLHRAVEQSPISIIITDTTGRIEYANAAFRGTTGYSGEEVLGHTMGDLKSGCNPTAVYKELWATIEAGQEWRGELCNKTKRGDLIWERVTISPVASPNGVIENYIGLRENVTELKRVQRALHIEHENTLRILSSMNDGICVIDTEFQVRYVNDAMRSAFGSPEGRHCHDYLYGESQPCPRCSMCSVQPEQGRHEWQAERTGKTYEVAETAVDGMDGARLKLCVFHDITVRKQAEEAMAKARASAEAANRAKTEFLAAMSHELRTPLNAIIGFSEIIADQVLGPVERRYADYAQDIRSSGRHLLALINDILDVAAIEIGRIVLQEAAVDVAAAVDGAVTMLRERAERSGIAMTIRAAPDLPLLLADERRIRQVLLNLVSNAVKFTPAGGRVEVQVGLSAAGDMVVRVTDTGIGIASEDIPKALAFFSQVDSSLARRYEGSGLGLPLTKGLVELHGGTLDLASEVGVGTAVTVTFPKRRVIAAATTLTDWSI